MRILVIGSPGAGKSELAKQLGDYIHLPVFHLDDYYWLENWQRPDVNEWLKTLDKMLGESEWILDGNYFNSLEQRLNSASHVIYLDYSVRLCLYRACKRLILRRFFSRDSLPIKIRNDKNYTPKCSFNLRFIFLILGFKIRYKKKIIQLIRKHNVACSLLKKPEESVRFIRQIELNQDNINIWKFL